jgi:hypothetical protein
VEEAYTPHTCLPILEGFLVSPLSDLTHENVRPLPSLILPGPHRPPTPARQAGMQSTDREAQAGSGEVDSGTRDIEDIQVRGARPHDREALVFIGTTFNTVTPAARTPAPLSPAASDSQWNSVWAEAQEGGGASGK